jgi:hypothetical protein
MIRAMRGDVSHADVVDAAQKAFGRSATRIKNIVTTDGLARILVHTDHRGGQITLEELVTLAYYLSLDAASVSLWDIEANVIEVIVDLEPRTPVERPPRV